MIVYQVTCFITAQYLRDNDQKPVQNQNYLDSKKAILYKFLTLTTVLVSTISMQEDYQTFHEFYPFYLSEHANKTCRRLHFFGSIMVLATTAGILSTQQWNLLIALPFLGYGFAWVGHFFYEKNRPATFRHPFYSFLGDWVMFKDILMGKIKI